MATASPALKKTMAKGKSKSKPAAPPQTLTVPELLTQFQSVAHEHMSVVKRIRTAIAPNSRIITAHGDTDK